MILSRKYAKKLISQGKVINIGSVLTNTGYYMFLTRSDMQRTDHYRATEADLAKVSTKHTH